jgi:hypothetical protein
MRLSLPALLATLAVPALLIAADSDGFQPIFDGRSLGGWEPGDASYWSVEAGAIVGRITRERPCNTNQYLVYQGGELADFELKLESRLNGEGGINNGFQFRSRVLPDHDVCGYQMDNNLQTPWLVRLYDEFGRHDLALRGQRTVFDETGARTTTRLEPEAPAWFKLEDWHKYHLVCVGPRLTLYVNGRLAAEVVDHDRRRQELQGMLALQLHSGPPTVVQFRNLRLKILKPAEPPPAPALTEAQKQRLALLQDARAWWPLDTGGHGATPPLRHIPGWEKFELNVRADGPGARPDTKVVLLAGAYFDAGATLHADNDQLTVFLRARDPQGKWDSALFAKRGGHDRVHFNLFSARLGGAAESSIGFEIRTDQGFTLVNFPASQLAPLAWHDLVGRYDGRNLSLFCDGRLLASKPAQGRLVRNTEPLLIGAETDNGQVVRHFHGELEEAALWSRALSDADIAHLSNRP